MSDYMADDRHWSDEQGTAPSAYRADVRDDDDREPEPVERRAERARLQGLTLEQLAAECGLGEHDDATILALVADPVRGVARVRAAAVRWGLICWDDAQDEARRRAERRSAAKAKLAHLVALGEAENAARGVSA